MIKLYEVFAIKIGVKCYVLCQCVFELLSNKSPILGNYLISKQLAM